MRTLTNLFRIVFIATLIVSFNSCDKDDADLISLSITEKTLNFEDEYQIEATSVSPITYSVENEYNAEVSETGLVTARFVGETNILLENAEDKKTFKVIVEPKYNLYPEPDVDFGDTKSSIIAQFGSDYIETSSVIGYSVIGYIDYSSAAPIAMFTFDTNDKLTGYAIMVKSSYSTTLADFLLERYLIVSERDGIYMFLNELNTTTATMAIGLQLYDITYWMVKYIPINSTTKSSKIKNTLAPNVFDELYKKMIERMK